MKTSVNLAKPLCVLMFTALLVTYRLPSTPAYSEEPPKFVDLSLLISAEYPCTWPELVPPFRIDHVQTIGRQSAYNVDTLSTDGNMGTQMDVPPHSVERPELNLPKSGPLGNEFTDKVPAWKFVGSACVVDLRDLLDTTPPGQRPSDPPG